MVISAMESPTCVSIHLFRTDPAFDDHATVIWADAFKSPQDLLFPVGSSAHKLKGQKLVSLLCCSWVMQT